MKITTRLLFLFALLVFCLPHASFAQNTKVDKLIYKADKLIFIKNYREALPLLLEATQGGDQSAATQYKIGFCYFNLFEVNDQVKAIPYLEKAIAANSQEVPPKAMYFLGQLYHKVTSFKKAIEQFNRYQETLGPRDSKRSEEVDERIAIANNALILISQSRIVDIKRMPDHINTEFTEYNPVVSTDESVIAYTALRPGNSKSRLSADYIEDIYISYRNANGEWQQPQKLAVNTKYNVGTAGISADGEKMLIFIGGPNNTGNLYEIDRIGNDWSTPSYLGKDINSNYLESTASITPDGKAIFFASNRPGGYGGMDIYKVTKDDKGNWSEAKNLGPKINTNKDEDAPFIHPDQRILFFTSNGHITMGGKDIFKSILLGTEWSSPENMGYPINTPNDDNYFTLTADGKKGFFSSDRIGGKGGQDIYYLDMPEEEANIPLTLVKGRILNGETLEPIPTTIKVVDVESGNKVDFVYNPNIETGNYLIIFPPGKNYDMIIESEGFMPYTININIPNQTYFYELYQKILLSPIKQFDVLVGQEVSVKNAFYDHGGDKKVSPRKNNEAMLVRNDSLDLYEVMDAIIASTDTTAFEYFLDLMYTVNPIDDIDFDSVTAGSEAAMRTYYYDESTEETLERKVVDGDTIFSLPTLHVTEKGEIIEQPKSETASYDKKLLEENHKVYFEVNGSTLKDKYTGKLNQLLKAMLKYENLGVEISGYASADGDPEYNRKLSNDRAIEVLNYFNHKGVVRRRIIARGFGETESISGNSQDSRRVEVRLVDLNAL